MTLFDTPMVELKGRGRLRLQPLDDSIVADVIEVEIDLHHEPAALTLGDLKVAARRHASEGHHEVAFRLWSAVATMAERRRYPALIVAAKANAEAARNRSVAKERRSQPAKTAKRYDYDVIARDVENGDTRSEVAARYGCAMSTVARAVEYVAVRDELLDESPELFDQLMAGVDVAEVARRYGVSPKIIRWLVRTRYDRRDER